MKKDSLKKLHTVQLHFMTFWGKDKTIKKSLVARGLGMLIR